MKTHMIKSEIRERAQATYFSRRFGCVLEKIQQGPGVCGDFLVTKTSPKTSPLEDKLGYPLHGRLIEFKDDISSVRWKSFYVEFEQTSSSWRTRSPSGHEKAIKEDCVLIISSGQKCFVYNKPSYSQLIENVSNTKTTSRGRNGNRPNSFTRARIVPLKRAAETACFMYNMS